jgi:hypothetical protein
VTERFCGTGVVWREPAEIARGMSSRAYLGRDVHAACGALRCESRPCRRRPACANAVECKQKGRMDGRGGGEATLCLEKLALARFSVLDRPSPD